MANLNDLVFVSWLNAWLDPLASDTITAPQNETNTVTVHGGNDTVFGGNLDDVLIDHAPLLAGAPNLGITSGNDTLIGGGGRDRFVAGDGTNTYDGGEGADTVDFSVATGPVLIQLQRNGDPFDGLATGFGTSELISIENAIGSNHGDVIVGTDGDNVLDGGRGRDLLIGGPGNDTLIGGLDDDFLRPGSGTDIVNGGAGRDTVDYYTGYPSTVGITVNLQTGLGSGGEAQGDRYTSIENIIGNGGADRLIGNGGDNIISGMGGRDVLTGGGGRDFFVFDDFIPASDFRTIITDFQQGLDIIDLSSLDTLAPRDMSLTAPPAPDFEFVTALTGDPMQVTSSTSLGNTVISIDVDGNGVGEHQIVLVGTFNLTASDFWL